LSEEPKFIEKWFAHISFLVKGDKEEDTIKRTAHEKATTQSELCEKINRRIKAIQSIPYQEVTDIQTADKMAWCTAKGAKGSYTFILRRYYTLKEYQESFFFSGVN
jgi:membrane-bound lytic murein transglycosylase B